MHDGTNVSRPRWQRKQASKTAMVLVRVALFGLLLSWLLLLLLLFLSSEMMSDMRTDEKIDLTSLNQTNHKSRIIFNDTTTTT